MKQIFSIIGRKILIGLMLTSSAVFGNQSREQILDKGGFAPELVTHEESTVIEHALEHMLMRMAEHNEEPTESLLRLYQAVTENTEIKIEDLNELLPVMVECMKAEQERAARPDAPDALGNGAISGCCGCCDLSQILAVLGSIQAKLVIINNLIVECCDEIRLDFQATWSILANLNVTATVDLNPVFSVITECCNGTFSTLANLSFTAIVDLNPVFTVLNACCNGTFTAINNVNNNVIATFSVLNQIVINQQGTFSAIDACCDGTFSAIADLKLSLTAITVNLNPVFTALAACCNGTFSVLNKIDTEVISTFSVLNTIIINEQGTFTALAACCNGTFSAIADIKSSLTAITVNLNPVFTALTACCNGTFSMLDKIDREVISTFSVLNTIIINEQGTFTAIAACCNGTFSVLANLSVTATTDLSGVFSVLANLTVTSTTDLSGVFSALAACCNGTFSVLNNLRVTATIDLSPICSAINAGFNGTFSSLNACCQATFSAIADIKSSLTAITVNLNPVFTALFDIKTTLTVCGAIPIFTSTEITASGNYCLANDIVGTITISSNEVHLDLNGFSIIAPTSNSPFGALSINNVDNVTVLNGQLYKLGVVANNCNNLILDSITSFSCRNSDINCTGVNRLKVTNYSIFNHFRSGACVTIISGSNISFDKFSVNNSQYGFGFAMDSIDTCQISNVVLNNPGLAASSGIFSNMLNLSLTNIMSQAGAVSVTTGVGISIENMQLIGSTNGLTNFSNVRDVKLQNCGIFDAIAPTGALCGISTGTNIVIRNVNAANCTLFNLISLAPAVDVAVENVSAFESILSNPVISANNTAFGGSAVGAQFSFNNVTINNSSFSRVLEFNSVSDVSVKGFKVTHNSSISPSAPMSFATIFSSPKVFMDDCIFSDNISTLVDTGNIIFASDSSDTRINNVVIERNSYAGSQNGIVLQSNLLTASAAQVTNCRIENNSIAGDGLVACDFIQMNGIASPIVAHNNISANAITRSDSIASTYHGIFNAASPNAIIRGNDLLGNLWTGSIDSNLIETSTIASIEYNTITGNVAGNDLTGISGAVDHVVIRGNVINFNRCGAFPKATGAGTAIAIVAGGARSVVEKNILNSNLGSGGGSIGLQASGTTMATMNEAQGQTNDYVTGGGLTIPIATLSYSTGVVTPVPAPLSSYHNLSMVP